MASLEEAALKAVRDPVRGQRNLSALGGHLDPEAFADLLSNVARLLPRTADPDMALNNLERLLAQPAARVQLPTLLESRGRGLDAVLQLLATSQFFADTFVSYPDFLDSIRALPRRNPSTAELTSELQSEVATAADDEGVLRAFRRFRHRHVLRIGINDVIRDRPLEEVTRELARLADASIEVALQQALRSVGGRFGTPSVRKSEIRNPKSESRADSDFGFRISDLLEPARVTVLAFGKLGGDELNYSSDIDVMFVYDHEGETTGRRSGITNSEFFARVVTEVVRLLSSHTDRGFAYRVDLRLRPEGNRGPLARSMASTLSYYDTMGRTWERQALIKLRHVAGDSTLARDFLASLEPFVYRKYFSFAEINEVKALKRQMEQRAGRVGPEVTDVKIGRGGIRDIEYTVQFLQLLNGGDLPAVRQRNTLLALESLEIAGCLNSQETYILADAYRFLRKTEHRLQLLFDLQTHKLPAAEDELRKLALRMGYTARRQETGDRRQETGDRRQEVEDSMPNQEEKNLAAGVSSAPLSPVPCLLPPVYSLLSAQKRSPLDEYESAPPALDARSLLVDPLDRFLKDLYDKTALDRTILNHLLHQAFADADSTGTGDPEADLILDPDPDETAIHAILSRYSLRDPVKALANLSQLARESVPFLSSRRCRHFLASIAPRLLHAVAETPDPDEALTQLERVSASLGAKAVLWELFSQNPPILKLYVELCAVSPYLSGLLINNPGMIDELLDSLVLNQPRSSEELRAELAELCRGASDPAPILHSFQDKEFLRIGVGDLLGKADIRSTTAALSDVADTVLNQVAELVEPSVREKLGNPKREARNPKLETGRETVSDFESRASGFPTCRYVLLGLGKLGGREISYHSDLDLLLIYESDGTTTQGEPNSHYFTELAQRIIRTMSRLGPMGRLYAVDMRLRPTGKSGSLVLPLTEFRRYFESSGCQLWERQSLGRARIVRGDAAFARDVEAALGEAMFARPWSAALVDELQAMRQKLESTASPRSLKRGRGGLVDVEFIVQLLQLKYGRDCPEIRRSNAWDALEALAAGGCLSAQDSETLRAGYSFLRLVEARLRIVTDRPLTEVPEDPEDLAKLAARLGFDSPALFLAEWKRVADTIRACFDAILARERN